MTAATSIWLYGSTARGDADRFSDIDVLVVSDTGNWQRQLDVTVHEVFGAEPQRLAPLHFSWREIYSMAEYGSLFLHHLRLEGRDLSDEDGHLGQLLRRLPSYRRAGHEVRAFRTVLKDVRLSIEGPHSPSFELSVVATALRHAFILGCYVSGQPDFGRVTPFQRLCPILGEPPRLEAELAALYEFRLYQHGRAAMPFTPNTVDVHRWLDKAETLLVAIQERVDVYDRTLHRAA
jgi:Nucleotidyltransferase domain